MPTNRITQTSKGGIADYVPTETNRHTKVELLLKKSGNNVGIDKETVTSQKATGYVSG